MNVCESEARVQNEYALRFPAFTKPAPLLEYIRTVSSLVGPSHVLAIFEENDTIKVFFDDRRLMDSLIKTGIHVMGHHLRAEYVMPPGTKVILSNIDPVISNFDVMRLLALYGTIVSPVVRPSISDDTELCHIGYGVRYVYMVLNSPLPSKLEFKYGDQLCYIKIVVEDSSMQLPCIKWDSEETASEINSDPITQDSVPSLPSANSIVLLHNPDIPVVVSVEGTISENDSFEKKDEEGKDKRAQTQKSKTIPVRRRGRYAKALNLKRKKVTAASQAARKISKKHKWSSKNIKHFKTGRRGRPQSVLQPFVPAISSSSSSDLDSSTPPLLSQESPNSETNILDTDSLKLFLEEVKHSRAPLELAKKYVGTECDSVKLSQFIEQLRRFNVNQNYNQSLKLRVSRLINSLQESIKYFG